MDYYAWRPAGLRPNTIYHIYASNAVNSQGTGPPSSSSLSVKTSEDAPEEPPLNGACVTLNSQSWQPPHDGSTDFPFCLRAGEGRVGQCQRSSGLVRIRPTSDDDGLTDELDNRFPFQLVAEILQLLRPDICPSVCLFLRQFK